MEGMSFSYIDWGNDDVSLPRRDTDPVVPAPPPVVVGLQEQTAVCDEGSLLRYADTIVPEYWRSSLVLLFLSLIIVLLINATVQLAALRRKLG